MGEIGANGAGNGGAVMVNGNILHVPLTNVADPQRIVVTLASVSDTAHTGDLVIAMNMLIGDTNGNKTVNSTDVGQAKAQSGTPVTAANFRTDVNVSGTVTASDLGQIKAVTGHTLP